METYFKVAYMTRSPNDTTTFGKLCEAFKVDTSKVIGNNKLSPPQRTFAPTEESLLAIKSIIETIFSEDMKGFKQLKSTEKNDVFDKIKGKLESINWENFYEMRQTEKGGVNGEETKSDKT